MGRGAAEQSPTVPYKARRIEGVWGLMMLYTTESKEDGQGCESIKKVCNAISHTGGDRDGIYM